MRECRILPELLDTRSVLSLVRWMLEVECFELNVDSLPEAIEALRTLTSATA